MRIFNRKKDFEEDEEKAKIKDLAPQNEKKRKEPVKPWGKKERILILSILVATIIISAVISFSSSGWKLPGLPKINFPSLDFLNGETITIEK